MLESGERQVSETVDGIRRDHVARYEWAAQRLDHGSIVIDAACGVGYGSRILADAGLVVYGYDIDEETIEYARLNYGGKGAGFFCRDITACEFDIGQVLVCFETIEHLDVPSYVLRQTKARKLLASVPNEDVFPYELLTNKGFHKRHYTKQQFGDLLRECGWAVVRWWTQLDVDGVSAEVIEGSHGHTLIVEAVRS